MRDLTCRGKAKSNGEWVYGTPTTVDGKWYILEEWREVSDEAHKGKTLRRPVFVEVDPNTIGRSTGLFDANRVEIFDGDIARQYVTYGTSVEARICRVYWNADDAAFYLATSLCKYVSCQMASLGCAEVIGNIYDNPELEPSKQVQKFKLLTGRQRYKWLLPAKIHKKLHPRKRSTKERRKSNEMIIQYFIKTGRVIS